MDRESGLLWADALPNRGDIGPSLDRTAARGRLRARDVDVPEDLADRPEGPVGHRATASVLERLSNSGVFRVRCPLVIQASCRPGVSLRGPSLASESLAALRRHDRRRARHQPQDTFELMGLILDDQSIVGAGEDLVGVVANLACTRDLLADLPSLPVPQGLALIVEPDVASGEIRRSTGLESLCGVRGDDREKRQQGSQSHRFESAALHCLHVASLASAPS